MPWKETQAPWPKATEAAVLSSHTLNGYRGNLGVFKRWIDSAEINDNGTDAIIMPIHYISVC